MPVSSFIWIQTRHLRFRNFSMTLMILYRNSCQNMILTDQHTVWMIKRHMMMYSRWHLPPVKEWRFIIQPMERIRHLTATNTKNRFSLKKGKMTCVQLLSIKKGYRAALHRRCIRLCSRLRKHRLFHRLPDSTKVVRRLKLKYRMDIRHTIRWMERHRQHPQRNIPGRLRCRRARHCLRRFL